RVRSAAGALSGQSRPFELPGGDDWRARRPEPAFAGRRGAPLMVRWPAEPPYINQAISRLLQGAVIAFPTDTLHAIGARARDHSAVRRLYAIKRRPADQPVVLLVADATQVPEWAIVTPRAADWMTRYWPWGPTRGLRRRPAAPSGGSGG